MRYNVHTKGSCFSHFSPYVCSEIFPKRIVDVACYMMIRTFAHSSAFTFSLRSPTQSVLSIHSHPDRTQTRKTLLMNSVGETKSISHSNRNPLFTQVSESSHPPTAHSPH